MKPYEKPQPGNPYALTVKQHCFPRSCIARFCNQFGRVELKRKNVTASEQVKPEAAIFCAKRSWDQRAETTYMLNIENKYCAYVDYLLSSDSTDITSEGAEIISAMYCLWSLRQCFRHTEIPESPVPGVTGVKVPLSKDDTEFLEKNHISCVRPDFTIPGRQIAGVVLQLRLNSELLKLKDSRWSLMRSTTIDFVVPDESLTRMILPLTPSFCFFHESEQEGGGRFVDVSLINRDLIGNSREYYFGRDLTKI